MRTSAFTIDRSCLSLRVDLAETIANHLAKGDIVQLEDSRKPPARQLRYTVQWVGDAGHVFDGRGRTLRVFADLDALVDHAETATA